MKALPAIAVLGLVLLAQPRASGLVDPDLSSLLRGHSGPASRPNGNQGAPGLRADIGRSDRVPDTAVLEESGAPAAVQNEPPPESVGSAAPTGRLHFVVGISPYLDAADRNATFRQLVRVAVEDLPLDSSLSVYDAYHLQSVARMVVPSVRAFGSSKTRLNQFTEPIQATRRFLARTNSRPQVPGLGFEGALRLPQFLDFVSENLAAPNQRLVVILLGNPLYQDEKEPGFSMASGYFPTDGHLLADRDKSVFGLHDRGRRLERMGVHLGYFGDPWANDLHREKITRFWRLFVERQGGTWSGMSGDLPTVFQTVQRGIAAVSPVERDDATYALDGTRTKVEMRRISRGVESTDWIAGDHVSRPGDRPPASTVGPMKIGIRWKGDLDLDLYARASAESERLYFEHARAREGYYYKDHRASPDREYEFIEFVEPVDVRVVEAAVNFYEGEARPGGVEAEVRIEFEGRIYTGQIRLSADRGNRGREGGGQSAFWYRLDLPALLKLSGDRSR